MAREPETIAALRRTLGDRLATFRQAADLTQGQLAKATFCDRSRVAHLERGTARADERFWQAADEAVGAEGALLRSFNDLQAMKHRYEHQVHEAQLAAVRAKADSLRHDDGSGSVLLHELAAPSAHSTSARRPLPAGTPAAAGAGEQSHGVVHGADMPTLPSPAAAVAASQDRWRSVRARLIHQRTQLARQAVELYDPAWRIPHSSTLALPCWLPPQPVPIEAVVLDWEPHPPRPVFVGEEAELRPVLPLRTPRQAFKRYSSAIRYLCPPTLFENRPSYRLLDVSLGRLRFGLATFFDKLDVSEALCHEFTAAAMAGKLLWSELPFRALLSRPFDLLSRTVCPGVATLTIRRNASDGSATFFLLRRDSVKVAVGGGQYGVVPAGEFQPSSIGHDNVVADLDLWRNIVREYSEELLGQPEHDGSSGQPLDYDCWPFYRSMQRARDVGRLRAYVLGVTLHALSLNAAVLTAVVIDDVVFDDIFRDLVSANAEGQVISSLGNDESVRGLPFEGEIVERLLRGAPLGGTSGACLALAWKHRATLLDHG